MTVFDEKNELHKKPTIWDYIFPMKYDWTKKKKDDDD